MRRRRQRGLYGTRAAWIPAALWVLSPAPSMLPLQSVEAQQAADFSPPASSAQADEQIMSLLRRVETLLDEGHVTSPAGGNASDVFSRALVLSSFASPAGLRTMAEFPSALKGRADAEQAAGHTDLSVRIEVFAEVVSSVISSRDTVPQADAAAPSTQSGVATEAAGTAGPGAQKAAAVATQADATTPGLAATEQAASPVSGETSRRDVGPSPSKAITDTRSALPALLIPTKPVAKHISPPAGETSPPASSGAPRNVETAKRPGRIQVAALPPAATAPAASPDGIAATPEPAKVPPPSAAMVDALLKQGKAMLSIGDISAARLLFARAAESGNGEAALALGDTYNPIFLAEHGVVGPQADLELAKSWYRKAFALGEPRARERLPELGGDTQAEARGSTNPQ